jgi:hypothetical protein
LLRPTEKRSHFCVGVVTQLECNKQCAEALGDDWFWLERLTCWTRATGADRDIALDNPYLRGVPIGCPSAMAVPRLTEGRHEEGGGLVKTARVGSPHRRKTQEGVQ